MYKLIQATVAYGTVTDEVRHDRNCSSRTFYVDLYIYRGAHKIFIQELILVSIPEELCIQAPAQRIFKILMRGSFEMISTGFPQDLLTRTCARSCKEHREDLHEDLFKSFSQGPVEDQAKASGSISLGSPQDLRAGNV